MFFDWFTNRKRARLIAKEFPNQWDDYLETNVLHVCQLTGSEQSRLRNHIKVFVHEKNWEGCGGLTMTDEIKVTIAAQACLLTLGLENVHYDHVLSILVYPAAYVAPVAENTGGGLFIEGNSVRMGEAWRHGAVVLSWADALAGGRLQTHGQSVVLHEFAHQLDMLNGGDVDGTPMLRNRPQYERWTEVLTSEYEALVNDCRRGYPRFLDSYGATNPGEFFAVVTEAFFEHAEGLLRTHPELYSVLSEYYGQDPVQWPSL